VTSTLDLTIAWMRGYIYGMENVLDSKSPIEKAYMELDVARDTLARLIPKKEEPSDSEQGQGGAVRSGPGE